MKIAVFDDEKYSREELIYQIRQVLPDADSREAASGAAAIEAVEQETFDLLFIDVHLGDIMGTTIAALVRKLMPNAQIVLDANLTAGMDPDLHEKTLDVLAGLQAEIRNRK